MGHRASPLLRLLYVLGITWLALGILARTAPHAVSATGVTASDDRPHILARAPSAVASTLRAPAGMEAAEAPRGHERILLFGDSMVPVLAPRLADYCLENGHELFPAAWYGSTIIYWAWQSKLDELLREVRPTMVIVVLGSSELTVRDVSECEPYVQAIIRKVGARKLVWVGPRTGGTTRA